MSLRVQRWRGKFLFTNKAKEKNGARSATSFTGAPCVQLWAKFVDHFEAYCKTDRVREVKNTVEKRSEGSPDFDILEISGCNAGRGSEWLAPATVDGKEISRSHLKWTPEHNQTCSHLWLHCVKKNTVLKKSAAVLGSCNGSVISHKRKTTLMVLCKQGIVEFFVVKKSRTSILGPQTCANS